MAARQGSHPAPAPRALAELRADSSPARRERIAGDWIVALVGSRPLKDLGGVPLERLARGAPRLCGQLIDAVRSEGALERLRESPEDAGMGELVGAGTAADLVDALELLRGVLSAALLDDLPDPSARRAADLCERVAHVCAAVLAGALPAMSRAQQTGGPGGERHIGASAPGQPTPDAQPGAATQPAAPPAGARPSIVDELESPPSPRSEPLVSRAPGERGAAIAVRDRRAERDAAEWLEAIARQLERHEPGELPFAVLLVELRDLERLRLQSTPARLAAELASLERELAAGGAVIRERPGRYWLLVPGADRGGARALAHRIAASASAAGGEQALATLIGIAVYPADGRHAAALAAHADVDLLAARAARR